MRKKYLKKDFEGVLIAHGNIKLNEINTKGTNQIFAIKGITHVIWYLY